MKKKLNLKELEVKSFVTNLDSNSEKTVKGGSHITGCGLCDTDEEGSACQTNNHLCETKDFGCYKTRYKICSYRICEAPIDELPY